MQQFIKSLTSARLIALLIAICATGGAWATDSLEETGGFVSSSSTLAFKGVSLSELTADTLSARMAGSWVSAKGTAVTFCGLSLSGSTLTCEAQMYEATTDFTGVKSIYLTFSQDGDDINVQATNVKSLSGGTLGTPVGSGGSSVNGGVPASTYTGNGYGLYNLSLTRSWSDSAVVIWEAGQFGVLSKTGSDGNTYTLNLNSNSNGSGEAITIDQSLGATIDFSSAFAAAEGGTVLIRYSNLPLDTTQRAIVTTKCGSNNDRTGVWINTDATAGKTGGVWGGGNHNSTGNTRTTLGSNKSAGVMAFTYHHTGGSYLYYLANGVQTTQHGDSGLKGNNDSISGIAIGGTRATSATGTAATGMKITGIAIFKGVLTESQMTSFVWPSAAARNYTRWSYAGTANVWTYATPSSVSGDEGIANNNVKYYVFDMSSGADTAQNYTGGNTANNLAYWTYFAYTKAIAEANRKYTAPGRVLRFVASDSYRKANINGKFSPFTLGGIIVEENATGYSIQYTTGDSGTLRTMALGDPTGTAETWFEFNEDFTINRTDKNALMGTLNFDIASGKTLTFGKDLELAETWTANNTGGNGYPTIATAGGTLKLHGGGKMTINGGNGTLTAQGSTLDYTDLAATVSSSSDAYIQGTLTVNSSTVIALPAGATFPYYIATGISGSLNSMTGVTIGGAPAPYYQANAAGYIEYVAPPEVTISSDATWGSGNLTGWATDDSTKDYIINVTADATLTLPSAVSAKTVAFNVSDGVTLTLDGTYAITAAEGIEINGARGAVAASTTAALSGSLSGNGVYWLKNATLTGFSAATIADADLTLRLTGCTGYFNGNTISPGTLDLQDDGNTKAFTVSNCSSSTAGAIVFAKLTGSGTFTASNADVFPRYAFTDPSSFTGTFAIPASVAGKTLGDSGFRPVRIILGAHGTLDPDKGTITVVSDTTATIAAGKTWTAPGGIEVDGTLNLGAGATAPKLKSGSDGMVVVASGTATVSGIDSSAISPTLGIMGRLAFADTTTTELTLTAAKLSNIGTLDLSDCTAVTTMNLVFGSTRSGYLFGTITPPPNLATVNVTVTEVLSEDGVVSLNIPASLTGAATLNVTVTGLDGTTKTVTKSVSGAVLSVSYTPTVSGAACWVDYEMNGSNANTGTEGTEFSYDGSYTAENSFYDSKFLYTYTHPYRNNLDAYPDSWTAVVRCTVPNLANAAIITFGNQTSGLIGLIAGDNPGSEMKLIQTTGNSTYSTKATMTVQDATSAQHVYVFAVENKRTLKCWCDGTQVLNENLAADVSIGNGFQIGSVVYGVGNTGIVRWWPGDTAFDNLDADVKTAARIDCLRLYKGVLGPNAIAQLSVEFPAVKLFQATIAGGNDNEWDSLSWTGGYISKLNEYSKIILTVTDDATLTLPSTVTAEEFTINVTAGKTLTLLQAAGGTTFTLTNPIEVNNGSLQFPDGATIDFAINGTGTVRVGSGETLNLVDGGSVPGLTGAGTLDCSSMSALPGAFAFNSWTGTVELPSFSASSGVNFNSYGTTGSTVALAGMTEGYILEAGKTVAPTLRLDGAMNITAMSSWTYTFAEITGTGNLSFSTIANSPTGTITKVAEGYSGTISSTLSNPVTITTLAREAGTSTASGTRLLSKSGNVVVAGNGTVTIGGEAQNLTLYYADDGVYVDGKVSSEGEGSSAVTTVTTDTETTSVSINLGDSYEGSVVVPPNVASVTTTGTSLATDKVIVKYGTTDISGAFTVGGSAGAITLALNANGSVTISDKTITVKPAVDTSDDPMTMPDETTAPAFNIKTIPGLWYVVRSGTSPSSLAAGDATQATTTTTGLAGPALGNEESVRYYTISVGRTAAEAAE